MGRRTVAYRSFEEKTNLGSAFGTPPERFAHSVLELRKSARFASMERLPKRNVKDFVGRPLKRFAHPGLRLRKNPGLPVNRAETRRNHL